MVQNTEVLNLFMIMRTDKKAVKNSRLYRKYVYWYEAPLKYDPPQNLIPTHNHTPSHPHQILLNFIIINLWTLYGGVLKRGILKRR